MIPKNEVRMTKQKLLIKRIIESSSGHLTADEIYQIAKKEMPSIALGTVYRNLGKLCEANEIGLISVSGKPDHYDKSIIAHGHLICDSCGAIEDFHLEDIKDRIEKLLDVEVISYDFNAHYLCENCNTNGE